MRSAIAIFAYVCSSVVVLLYFVYAHEIGSRRLPLLPPISARIGLVRARVRRPYTFIQPSVGIARISYPFRLIA